MDPINPGPEEYGHDGVRDAPRQRPPRGPITSGFGQPATAPARTVQLVSGDFLLTVNPIDGSEIKVCPPGERPEPPVKYTPAERAELARAAQPPVPPGPAQPRLPLLERREERERLVRLLARGRSVRLTGPPGCGRSALADVVAEDCADLAPDGVIRLCGYRRTTTDLLYDLFAAVHKAPLYRPERDELLQYVRGIGAVVVLDDLEFGGSALDELLDATPECAFLFAATPDVPPPAADSHLEEVFLSGLGRTGGLELLERAVGRPLTDEEANWAGDLWFESEGLPLRFMQAGALLRQRDRLRADESAVDEFGVFQDVPSPQLSASPERGELDEQAGNPVAPFDAGEGGAVPLPSLAQAAAPAPLLASRLSAPARETLKFAVALGGEVPHQTHLPALVDDTHADAALGELAGCALVSPVGSRYRLAAGVQAQLEAAGYATGAQDYALKAARHYAWWAGHPSVIPERVSAEADALLAALTVLVQLSHRVSPSSPLPASLDRGNPTEQGGPPSPPAEDEESAAVLLARQGAPAFAAGLHWSAWERALRSGAEASRLAGEVSDQAYFHHELGVLALCGGQLDRARAELEASIGLRGALADKHGTVAGRRALALVADRSGTTPPGGRTAAGEEVPDARQEEPASPRGGVPAGFRPSDPAGDTATLVTHRSVAERKRGAGGVRSLVKGTRRNLVAAGAGAALAAVLGTVVTLGMTSSSNNAPSDNLRVGPSASQGGSGDGLGADKPDKSGADTAGTPTPTNPGPQGTYDTSGAPTPGSTGGRPSDRPTGPQGTTPSKSPSATAKPPTKGTTPPPTRTAAPPPTKTSTPPPTKTTTPPPTNTTTPPATTTSASGPASGAPTTTSNSAGAPQTGSDSGTQGNAGSVI